MSGHYGFKYSFNPTFSEAQGKEWILKGYYGLDQGPIVLMIETYRSGFLWRLMRSCSQLLAGFNEQAFPGGWL